MMTPDEVRKEEGKVLMIASGWPDDERLWVTYKGINVIEEHERYIEIPEGVIFGRDHPGNRAVAGDLGRLLIHFEKHGCLPDEVPQ